MKTTVNVLSKDKFIVTIDITYDDGSGDTAHTELQSATEVANTLSHLQLPLRTLEVSAALSDTKAVKDLLHACKDLRASVKLSWTVPNVHDITQTLPLAKKLPTTLPEGVRNLRLLDTVGSIEKCGKALGNDYLSHWIQKACGTIQPACHLIRLDMYDGDIALAEVSLDGRLILCLGPENRITIASILLSKILTEWVKEWPIKN